MWAGRQAADLNLGLEPKLEGKSSLRELDRRAHTVQQGLNLDHGLPKYAMRPPGCGRRPFCAEHLAE